MGFAQGEPDMHPCLVTENTEAAECVFFCLDILVISEIIFSVSYPV